MPNRRRTRVVFWPFSLFGNPGGEAGVAQLSEALVHALAEHADEPASRLHEIARATKVEVQDYLQVEDFVTWRADIKKHFAACRRSGDFPIFVGGNHLTALPVYEAYSALKERVCVVQLDAHLDIYDLVNAKERLHHGNFLLHLAKGPRLSIVNIGHRDLLLDRARIADFFDRDVPIEEIATKPIEKLFSGLKRHLRGFDLVHLDIDLDVFDPSVLRAVATPVPCGLMPQQALALLGAIWSEKLAGVTLSEYSAAADFDGSGQHFVTWLLETLLVRAAAG